MPRYWCLIIAGSFLTCLCLTVQGSADFNAARHSTLSTPGLNHHLDSVLQSYLYIEPYEVRLEILVQVKDLEAWMGLGLRGDEHIEIDELEPLLHRIGAFLLNMNPVHIDGRMTKPLLESSSYVLHGLQGIELLEPLQQLETSTAIVGVILTFLTDRIPQQVSIDWQLFSEQVQQVPVMTTDPSGAQVSYVTPEARVHTWKNFLQHDQLPIVEPVTLSETPGELRIPIGTLLCVLAILPVGWEIYKRKSLGRTVIGPGVLVILLTSGAMFSWATLPTFSIARPAILSAALSEKQSAMLLQSLLKNIYLALNHREQQDIYEGLALTVSDDLMEKLFLRHRKSFAVPQINGTTARIKQVAVLSANARQVEKESLAYEIHGQWSAVGTVGHWGDVHLHQNIYDAKVTVEVMDSRWKVTGLELLEEKRVEPRLQPAARASRKM